MRLYLYSATLACIVFLHAVATSADDADTVTMTQEQIKEHIAQQYAAIAERDQAIADLLEQIQAQNKAMEKLKSLARACKS